MLATSTRPRILSAPPATGAHAPDRAIPYIRIVRTDPPQERRAGPSTFGDVQCRILNVMAALVGIALTAPLMALIALAIKLSSRGPVLYTQQRVGIDRRLEVDRRGRGMGSRRAEPARRESDQGGEIFTIYKFRTMRARAEQGQQTWASKDDPRITAVGHVLRKYRLDELPQLLNVLQGNMNIVGPRPEQPEIFGRLRKAVDRYVERQRVLPGITGWAQVNHQYDQSIEDVKRKVALDLEYIKSRSAIADLRIMALTLPVMVGRRGAI